MAPLLNDWRVLAGVSFVAFGTWGFLAKWSSHHLSWTQSVFVVTLTTFLVVAPVAARGMGGLPAAWSGLAVAAGILAGLGTLAMYRALSLAPASVVLPLISLNLVVTVLLSVFLLGEPLAPRTGVGLILALAAAVLLAA